jgi:hypothetical protein
MQVVFGEVQLDIGDMPSREKAEPKPADKSVPPPAES